MNAGAGLAVARRRSVSMRPSATRPGKAGASEGAAITLALAPLLTIVSVLDLLVKGELAFCVRRRERLDGAGEERPVVGLQLQGVVAALGADLTRPCAGGSARRRR